MDDDDSAVVEKVDGRVGLRELATGERCAIVVAPRRSECVRDRGPTPTSSVVEGEPSLLWTLRRLQSQSEDVAGSLYVLVNVQLAKGAN